jgi:TonB family protein
MTRGKRTCKILKEIRQQIAEKNEIEYVTSECHFQGECQGTCPKCEAEVRYLENELQRRKQMGKVVAVAGISLGIASTFSACNDIFRKNPMGLEVADTIPKDPYSVVMDWMSLDSEGHVFEPWDDTTVINNDKYIWRYVDIYPEYPGGREALLKFISKHAKYPQEAKENNWQGDVDISFVVEKDGSVTNVEIRSGCGHPILDEEALRVAKLMPKWKPGELKGKTVRVKKRIPVTFKLDNE